MKSEETGSLAGVRSALELATGAIGLVAATGYISLRARVNVLGVVADGFEPETYLFEAYRFLAPAIATLIFPSTALFAGSALLANVSRSIKFWRTRLADMSEWKAVSIFVLSAVILLCFGREPQAADILQRPLSTLSAVSSNNLSISGLCVFCLLLGNFALLVAVAQDSNFWIAVTNRVGDRIASWGRLNVVLLAVCSWWVCIINYNVHLRPIEFRQAAVAGKNQETKACGFLIITTNASYALWIKADGDEGRLIYIPKDGATLGLGRRFSLQEAAAALRGSGRCAEISRASHHLSQSLL